MSGKTISCWRKPLWGLTSRRDGGPAALKNFGALQFSTICPEDGCDPSIERLCTKENYQLLATTALWSSQRGATGRGTGPAGAIQSTGPPLQTVEEALRLSLCRLERVKGARLALRVTYRLPSCLPFFQLGRRHSENRGTVIEIMMNIPFSGEEWRSHGLPTSNNMNRVIHIPIACIHPNAFHGSNDIVLISRSQGWIA